MLDKKDGMNFKLYPKLGFLLQTNFNIIIGSPNFNLAQTGLDMLVKKEENIFYLIKRSLLKRSKISWEKVPRFLYAIHLQ